MDLAPAELWLWTAGVVCGCHKACWTLSLWPMSLCNASLATE
uniref:Uncharacterized protein n=1 Tax=Anguilla anguilla TaxID=7936 RepID=A0A0E9W4M7_ANGAN